jgi:hypothetical protein
MRTADSNAGGSSVGGKVAASPTSPRAGIGCGSGQSASDCSAPASASSSAGSSDLRASERNQALPVVLISAALLERPWDFPEHLVFDDVALKPLSAAALIEILRRHLGLVWEYAEADRGNDESAPSPAQLNETLSLGAVVAIEQWAVGMTEDYPDCAPLWAEIGRRATNVDLAGLRAMYPRLQAAASGAAASDPATTDTSVSA